MRQVKFSGLELAVVTLTIGLVACGGNSKKNASTKDDPQHSVVMVTDTVGIDDKSFNQSMWEGIQEWGKGRRLPEESQGCARIQSNEASDYTSNIDQTISSQFRAIFGVGCLLRNAVVDTADASPEANFVLIDDTVNGKNSVTSATSRDNKSVCLVGVTAVNTTKANKVGFIGGAEGPTTGHFQAGFEKGIADANKKLGKGIQIIPTYAGTSADALKGQALVSSVYQTGTDIIYHIAATTGQGIFQEVKTLNETGSRDKIWVIGVDRNRNEDGKYTTKDGKDDNLTLASAIKGANIAMKKTSSLALEDKFPGGEHLTYGLKDGGVNLTAETLSDQTRMAAKETEEQVVSDDVEAPDQFQK